MSNPITDLLKFVYNDFKTDIMFLSDLADGKRKIKFTAEQLEELKDWRGILKSNWIFFIIVVSAFCAGYFFAQVQLNNACVNALTQWYSQNQQSLIGTGDSFEFMLNGTMIK